MAKYLDATGVTYLWSKIKALIPTTLPANGGNADTVDDMHASDFATSGHIHHLGGRNLLRGTSMTTVKEATYPTSGYKDLWALSTTTPLDGLVYTLSFWAKSTVDGDRIVAFFYNPDTTREIFVDGVYKGISADGSTHVTLTTEWTKHWVTWHQTATNATKRVIPARLFSYDGTGTVSIKGVKLEEGDCPSDWSPAPEDAVSTAVALQTARTLTIGSTGKKFDGSAAVSWSLDEIGAAASSHTHGNVSTSAAGFAPKVTDTSKFLKGDGTWATPTDTTYDVATTSKNGLMGAVDRVNLTSIMRLQGTQYFDRAGVAGVQYLGLFNVTGTNIIVNNVSVSPLPIVEFEVAVVSAASTSSVYACAAFKCILCLSSTPTITWEVKNSVGEAVANAVKGITYDKTNKTVLLNVDSSSSYLTSMYLRTYVYRNDHCQITENTTTEVGSDIVTFTL